MPVFRFHCHKCDHEFQLVRPPSKGREYVDCPKCGQPVSPTATAMPGVGPPPPPTTPSQLRELPPWARGQVEAQVRQLVSAGDAIGGQQVELVTQAVLRELAASGQEITPAHIRQLAQQHLSGMEGWARTARQASARLDQADKLEED